MLRNMLKAKRKKTGIKYQFVVRVPRTSMESLELDVSKVPTYWSDTMEKEKNIIAEEYNSFK